MDFFQAIILGVVEGLTEFLPISSTGHLILAAHWLRLEDSEFLKSFEIAIQLGAILSVVVLYWRKLFYENAVLSRVATAFLPTALLGALLYPYVKILLGNETVVLWALFLGGVALILFEYWHREKEEAVEDIARLSYAQAFSIGLFQVLAMIPGVSRSGATIVGGLLLGLKRATIVEFSFLLAVPTMAAATLFDVWKNWEMFSLAELDILLIGFLVSFGVALFAIKFFLAFIRTHTFVPFGIYRIIAALAFFWWIL